ncbi:MAG: phosphatase PAP2 family protein [Blautia sp.]|nr:phosphatase PAP2 family protein [Blautia sp.]
MHRYCSRLKHGLVVLVYGILYFMCFTYIEGRDVASYHIIHTVFDDMIPFCEFFVIPYLLWFFYMFFAVAYFILFGSSKKEYYHLVLNLMMGMTLFLVVSYFYPNMQQLRPTVFPRENWFTHVVRDYVYKMDTPTNILPSIHVFNSLAIHMSMVNSRKLKDHKIICRCSLILTILIILSTMFLKQHSVIDVFLGMTLALFGYLIFYPLPSTETEKDGFAVTGSSLRRKKHYRKRTDNL